MAKLKRVLKQLGFNFTRMLFGKNLMGTVTHVATDERVAAITFDDGPHPDYTPRLLDILEQHNARGTFFIVGKNAQRYPDIVKRMSEAGHAVCNHSWDHTSFPQLTSAERCEQINKCAAALGAYGQKIFRPPYGHLCIASRLDALRLGYTVVMSNVAADDWLDPSPEWMADKVVADIKPGSIMLFHDMLYTFEKPEYSDREAMLQAMEMMLQRLPDYSFVTLPELLKHGKAVKKFWHIKGNKKWLASLQSAESRV